MKHKKATALIILVAILLASIAVQSSYAFLQDQSSVSNTFTPAAVQITIDGGSQVNNAISIPANTSVNMPVSISNKSASSDGRAGASAYIRVAIVPIWCHQDGTGTGLPSDNVTLTLANGAPSDWMLGKDGYYYYKYPLAPGTSTSQLLSSVKWSITSDASLNAEYQNSCLEIQVLADAIQSLTGSVENYWDVSVDSEGNLSLTADNTP